MDFVHNPYRCGPLRVGRYGLAWHFACLSAMARDGELIQMRYFCHHSDTICQPNSSYATTKVYETSACGCNNNTIFQNELFSRFLPSMYGAWQPMAAQKPWWCCESRTMATLMNLSFFVFKISLLRNYHVKYYDHIVNWCSDIACDWCASLDIVKMLALIYMYYTYYNLKQSLISWRYQYICCYISSCLVISVCMLWYQFVCCILNMSWYQCYLAISVHFLSLDTLRCQLHMLWYQCIFCDTSVYVLISVHVIPVYVVISLHMISVHLLWYQSICCDIYMYCVTDFLSSLLPVAWWPRKHGSWGSRLLFWGSPAERQFKEYHLVWSNHVSIVSVERQFKEYHLVWSNHVSVVSVERQFKEYHLVWSNHVSIVSVERQIKEYHLVWSNHVSIVSVERQFKEYHLVWSNHVSIVSVERQFKEYHLVWSNHVSIVSFRRHFKECHIVWSNHVSIVSFRRQFKEYHLVWSNHVSIVSFRRQFKEYHLVWSNHVSIVSFRRQFKEYHLVWSNHVSIVSFRRHTCSSVAEVDLPCLIIICSWSYAERMVILLTSMPLMLVFAILSSRFRFRAKVTLFKLKVLQTWIFPIPTCGCEI